MKKLILLLSIITICYSCKKETLAPLNFTPTPPKDQRWRATIKYTEDSLNTYFRSGGGIEIIIIDSLYSNGLVIEDKFQPISAAPGNSTYSFHLITQSYDVPVGNPLTYWIKVISTVQRQDMTLRQQMYYKKYTFVNGNNGTIDFNTIP